MTGVAEYRRLLPPRRLRTRRVTADNRGKDRLSIPERGPTVTVTPTLAERVLVVPGAELDRLGRFQGYSPEADRYLSALLVPGLATFRPRSEVEDDPSFKQIVPYVVFRSGAAVFCYTRGKSGGE